MVLLSNRVPVYLIFTIILKPGRRFQPSGFCFFAAGEIFTRRAGYLVVDVAFYFLPSFGAVIGLKLTKDGEPKIFVV